jgi:hypothetical protein
MKFPYHLSTHSDAIKCHRFESRPSIATSTTSEDVFTQTTVSASDHTFSETGTCGTSIASTRYNDKKKRQLDYWTEVLEARMSKIPHEDDGSSTGESLMELGTMNLYCEVSPFANLVQFQLKSF